MDGGLDDLFVAGNNFDDDHDDEYGGDDSIVGDDDVMEADHSVPIHDDGGDDRPSFHRDILEEDSSQASKLPIDFGVNFNGVAVSQSGLASPLPTSETWPVGNNYSQYSQEHQHQQHQHSPFQQQQQQSVSPNMLLDPPFFNTINSNGNVVHNYQQSQLPQQEQQQQQQSQFQQQQRLPLHHHHHYHSSSNNVSQQVDGNLLNNNPFREHDGIHNSNGLMRLESNLMAVAGINYQSPQSHTLEEEEEKGNLPQEQQAGLNPSPILEQPSSKHKLDLTAPSMVRHPKDATDVIELLDDDDDNDDDNDVGGNNNNNHNNKNNYHRKLEPGANASSSLLGVKRPRSPGASVAKGGTGYRNQNNVSERLIPPKSSLATQHDSNLWGYPSYLAAPVMSSTSSSPSNSRATPVRTPAIAQMMHDRKMAPNPRGAPLGTQAAAIAQLYARKAAVNQNVTKAHEHRYVHRPEGHRVTWETPLPSLPAPTAIRSNQPKAFELSLLNVSEFTITGLPVSFDGRPSSVLGFRKIIKQFSSGHGTAVFERDKDPNNDVTNGGDGGRWRVPLGAYRALYGYLHSDPNCRVTGIPEEQLKIASMGRARLEKGFPSAKKMMAMGVPEGLATTLAPFQRGGVEFVVEKEGRALIADDMGLGKTIQGIASMSVYHDDWPLLVLTPSSARYHWESEFQHWLGADSSINKPSTAARSVTSIAGEEETEETCREENIPTELYKEPMRLLNDNEIHVITSGKEEVIPTKSTRVVICSYGLAPSLVESNKIYPGLFKSAIVDESHMLKNIKAKRTSRLVPVLHATQRCVLLSGTPALARPAELWPQLKMLSTERDCWWDDEAEFVSKYVQRTSAIRRAELHTMLTGTVMIRRMKHDILKSLPSKNREKGVVDVATPAMRLEFHKCMELLREGKGVMAKLAKQHSARPAHPTQSGNEGSAQDLDRETIDLLKKEYRRRYEERCQPIWLGLQNSLLNDEEKQNFMNNFGSQIRNELDVWYRERIHELQNGLQQIQDEQIDRKSILNRMYSLTAKAKISLIADMVKQWLADPSKGKLCVFAHHIFVLDDLIEQVGLSNTEGSDKRYIRIDGSTSPRERQARIKSFQEDPSVRIAVLGITAAGVAVTLTAASTVWFAELFWTPALMIQAEDRCHRIGQNAVVRILYFVASGTLDVLLWDLLEKKFRDLGEFVEGKEKMKIVVHHTYDSVKDLQSIFSKPDNDESDDEVKTSNSETNDSDADNLIRLEDDLKEDIVQLAQEEMIMISQGEDEDGADSKLNMHGVQPESNSGDGNTGLGQTEDEAICLLDDEDVDEEIDENPTAKEQLITPDSSTSVALSDSGAAAFDKSKAFSNCRIYTQLFEGTTYGIQLLTHEGRLVVSKQMQDGNVKPAPGDILVAINGAEFPLNVPLQDAVRAMKEYILRAPVELTLIEDEEFASYCKNVVIPEYEQHNKESILKRQAQMAASRSSAQNVGGVIEILDDD